jgi:carboxyl-terminal processing protease
LRHEFLTTHKRPVWESGGILPDTIVADTVHVTFLDELNRKAMLFKYANRFASENKTLPDSFEVTDGLINDFEIFLKQKGFEYQEDTELRLKELRTQAANARYDKSFLDCIDKLEMILKADKKQQIHRYQEEVRSALKTEILARMKGDKARFESTFSRDKQLQTAINIIKNINLYNKLLGMKGK